jgi:hypothetical protein
MRNLDPAQKEALQIMLREVFSTKEEPRMEEEQEGPEIEIELPAEKMGRSNRLERAFKKVDKYNAI